MKNVKMLNQRVLVEALEEAPKTNKLLIPESITKNLGKGKVIVSPSESKLRPNDIVLFDNRATLPLTLEGKDYLVLQENTIFMVIGHEEQTNKRTKKAAVV